MSIFIMFLGMLFLLFSGMFFFAPKIVIKLSEIGNRLIFTDHGLFAHRKWSAFFLFIMSIIMFYLGVTV